jgi:predicted flap endonuclease-1-like 5' DNA nuclease
VEEPAEPEELREDDFTQIEGIGPKISVLLHAAGIHTFADLAEADTGRIRQVLSEAGARFSLADPTSWPEQAHYLEAGDQENFKRITQRLKGGRQVE